MKRVIYVLKYAFDILYDIFAHLLFILSIFLSMSKKLFFVFVVIFFVFVLIMTGNSIQKTAQKKFCYAYVFSSDDTFNLQNKSFLSSKFYASAATLSHKLQVVDKNCLEYVYAYAYSKKHLAETFKDPRRFEIYKKEYEEFLNDIYEKEKIYIMQLGQSFWKKMLNKLATGIYYFLSLFGIYVK